VGIESWRRFRRPSGTQFRFSREPTTSTVQKTKMPQRHQREDVSESVAFAKRCGSLVPEGQLKVARQFTDGWPTQPPTRVPEGRLSHRRALPARKGPLVRCREPPRKIPRSTAVVRDEDENLKGTGPWKPTLAHKTHKDGAPGRSCQEAFSALAEGKIFSRPRRTIPAQTPSTQWRAFDQGNSATFGVTRGCIAVGPPLSSITLDISP